MSRILRIAFSILLLTCACRVTAQTTKYAFVHAQVNCAGRFAISNVFPLSGNALNLSKEDICARYRNHHFITNNCGSLNSFDNCTAEIYDSYNQAKNAYDLLLRQSQDQFGGSSVYLTLFFSINSWDGPTKPIPSNKHYMVPYVEFINGSCGSKMAIGEVIAYDCSPLSVMRNFDAFYNKHYAKGIGYFITIKSMSDNAPFSNYDEAVKWRQAKISNAAGEGITVYHISDFNDACQEMKYPGPAPTIKPLDIAGTWKFVLSWPTAPNLPPLHGKVYFDIAGDGIIKGRMISDPGERLAIHYTFTNGEIKYNSLSFNAQTAVPGITQVYELTFNCLFKLTGTARNVFNKSVTRQASDDIPATIELTR